MNATEITPQSDRSRLKRIKIVSRIFRVFIGLLALMMLFVSIVFVLGSFKCWLTGDLPRPNGLGGKLEISFSPNQTYTAPFHIPLSVFLVGAAQLGLGGFGLILLNRLFTFYEQGHFFKSSNIRCLKFLGLVALGLWLTQTVLEMMALNNHSLSLSGLVYATLILLIAWIMDQGRKIQEEQALTV